ncbi:hypothetical protein JYT22_00720 [Endomicrobium sp. AH-315-J14]|nr:hypothetical protein [Endomicrobium sp. AH-315-J14]
MSDDPFVHDESLFDPVEVPTGVDVSDVEAKYAELFREVIWDGSITAEKRAQLKAAAKVFGLGVTRANQIEKALTASYEARHNVHLVDDSRDDKGRPIPIAPFAPAKDPRLAALQRRIKVLETNNARLEKRAEELTKESLLFEAQTDHVEEELDEALSKLEQADAKIAGLEAAKATQGAIPRPAPKPAAVDSGATTAPAPVVNPADAVPENVQVVIHDGETTLDVDVDIEEPVAAAPRPRRRSRRVLRDSNLPDPPHGIGADEPHLLVRLPAIQARRSRGNPAEIHRIVRMNPRDAEILRVLWSALQRDDDLDRRWCIAATLVYLGEANDEELAMYVEHTQAGLVRPSRAINEDEWMELLRHPEEDALTGEILASVARAVLLGPLNTIRGMVKDPELDPSQRVDPKTSTLQAARCFSWAAAILGVKVPPLYAVPTFPGAFAMVPLTAPAFKLGKDALVGRSGKELAFIAGRALSWYRKEHILGKVAMSVPMLEDVFVASLMIGNPGLPITPEIKKRVQPLTAAISPLLDADVIERLQLCFGRFVEHGGRTNLVDWLEGADRTAACTGLLLCNDLTSAEKMLELEDKSRLEDRMNELLVFFTADRCSLLRKRIGLAIRPEEGWSR